jgi:hypothetical protein
MQIIQEKAPSALREGGSDKTIVVINNIDRPTFDILQECLNQIRRQLQYSRR